jgi:SspJ family small acid-soluble spore protein
MAKVLSEEQSRDQILGWCRKYGCEEQALKIFSRYDDLLKGAKTREEREAIQIMGNCELHDLFGAQGALEVNGKTIKEDPAYEAQQKRLKEEELIRRALTRKI